MVRDPQTQYHHPTHQLPQSPNTQRFSTYSVHSGAPSLQPSLASTYESRGIPSVRTSQATTYLASPDDEDLHHAPAADNSKSQRKSHRHSYYISSSAASNATMQQRPAGFHHRKSPSSTNSSTLSFASADHPAAADLRSWSGRLERMQNPKLERQRYEMSAGKGEEVSKLALGAKLERALGRRMDSQDAQFRRRSMPPSAASAPAGTEAAALSEKRLEVRAG